MGLVVCALQLFLYYIALSIATALSIQLCYVKYCYWAQSGGCAPSLRVRLAPGHQKGDVVACSTKTYCESTDTTGRMSVPICVPSQSATPQAATTAITDAAACSKLHGRLRHRQCNAAKSTGERGAGGAHH